MDLQKRTFIATALSILIIIAYSALVPKAYHTENKEVKTNIISSQTLPAPVISPQTNKDVLPPAEEPASTQAPIIFSTDKVDYEFSKIGANLLRATFKQPFHKAPAKFLLRTNKWSDLEFESQIWPDRIKFTHKTSEQVISKEYSFSEQGYLVKFIITSSPAISYYDLEAEFLPLSSAFEEKFKETSLQLIGDNILRINNLRIKKAAANQYNQPLKWVGLRDKYFAYILAPVSMEINSLEIAKNNLGNDLIKLSRPNSASGSQTLADSFLFYCGPQSEALLAKAGLGFEQIRYFGWLDPIAKLLLKALSWLNNLVHSWGLAIVILTIIIYFCLYPLTLNQMRSMRKMQVLQPEMEAVRKQYKDNPQRQNKEIMELYKKHNANPLGGCLPVLLQIPVFFALFQALYRGIELKGAHFLWIKDLSEPDKFLHLGTKDVNLLPILMTVAMFFQQKMSMSKISGPQAEQQKMMLWTMPLVFAFIFYNMASGLVLYWFVNSLLMMFTQWKVSK